MLLLLLHDQDTLPGGCLHIDVVHTGACSAHHLQPLRCLQHVSRDFGGRADDESIAVLGRGDTGTQTPQVGPGPGMAVSGWSQPGVAVWGQPLLGDWDPPCENRPGSCIRREAGTGTVGRGGSAATGDSRTPAEPTRAPHPPTHPPVGAARPRRAALTRISRSSSSLLRPGFSCTRRPPACRISRQQGSRLSLISTFCSFPSAMAGDGMGPDGTGRDAGSLRTPPGGCCCPPAALKGLRAGHVFRAHWVPSP